MRGRIAALALVASTVVIAGCDAGAPPPAEEPTQGSPTVVVTRDTVTSVVTLDARIQSQARAVIGSPEDATDVVLLHKPGDVVPRNTPIAEYRVRGNTKTIRLAVEVEVVERIAPQGASVQRSAELFVVAVDGLAFVGSADPIALYRLAGSSGDARAQVVGGPGPIDCPLVGQPALAEERVTVVCSPTDAVDLYPGSAALIAVRAGRRKGVLTLPLSAVAGSAQRGTVARKTTTGFEQVDVELGISNGSVVEIVSGLAEGDEVSQTPPDLSVPEQPR